MLVEQLHGVQTPQHSCMGHNNSSHIPLFIVIIIKCFTVIKLLSDNQPTLYYLRSSKRGCSYTCISGPLLIHQPTLQPQWQYNSTYKQQFDHNNDPCVKLLRCSEQIDPAKQKYYYYSVHSSNYYSNVSRVVGQVEVVVRHPYQEWCHVKTNHLMRLIAMPDLAMQLTHPT